jgi:hypothetical protein
MRLKSSRVIRYREAARMSRLPQSLQELPLDIRLYRLRKSRRKLAVQRFTQNVLWVVIVAALGIFIATELMAAIGRA